jgi:hypothetical protein
MEAIKKKMQAMKVEKDNACDRYILKGTLCEAGGDLKDQSAKKSLFLLGRRFTI